MSKIWPPVTPRPARPALVTTEADRSSAREWQFDGPVARDGMVLFTGRLLAFLVVFLTPIVLTRVFSVEEFGLYRQVFLIHASVSTILMLGLPASLYYFVLRDPRSRPAYISQTLLLLGVTAVGGGTILAAQSSAIGRAMNNSELGRLTPLLAVLIVVSTWAYLLEGLMIASKRPRLAAATHLASEVIRVCLVVGAALLMKSVAAVLGAAVVWAGARCVGLLAYIRHLGVTRVSWPDRARLAAQWRNAFPFGLAGIVETSADSLHFYLVALVYNVGTFAAYSVGFMAIPLVDIAVSSLVDVTLVRVTELKREERLSEAQQVVASTTYKLSLALFPAYVWLLINAHDVIRIVYTDRFADSATIFVVSLCTIPLSAIALDYVPRGFGDTPFVLRANLVRLVLTGLLVLLLAHQLGPIGAAGGTILALAATKGMIIRHVSRLMAVPAGRLLPWRRLGGVAAVSGAAGLLAMAVKEMLPLSPALSTLASALPFSLAYVGLTWRCGVLKPEEKAGIRRAVLALGRIVDQHA